MIKKFLTFFVALLSINAFAQNLFQNPGFENGLDSNYVSFVKTGGEATFTIAADTSVQGDSILVVDIKTIPGGGPQVIGIYQFISGLDATKAYEFKFAAKGPAGQKVRARIQGDSKQIKWFDVTNSYKYYTWKINPLSPSSDGLHKIGLEFGDLPENQAGGLWYIDNWSFTEVADSVDSVEPGSGNLTVAYVSPDGNDENAGTKEAPLKTLKSAIQQLAGDTIYLLEGTYHEEIQVKDFSGTSTKPKVITAFPGHKVKFDGTVPINSEWELYDGSIYKTTIEQDIWQLFENEKMLNAARWPNVEGFIEDEQPVAPLPHPNSLWDQPGTWGKSAYNSTNGNMIDDGTQNLAGVETSFAGGIAILNIGSFRTSSARIYSHNPGESWFRYYSEDLQVHWEKPDMAYYYIEGKLSLLDHPGEWFYEPSTKELFVWTKSGAIPYSGSICGKVQTYALNLTNCKHVKIQGINFFATTIKGDGCEDITVEDNIFSYPGYSKRMLRDQTKTSVTEFKGACKNLKITNNVFQYTEGEAFHLEGSEHLIENNLLRHIDFSCVNLYMIGGTVNFKGENNIFRNNTIYVAGASETVTPGSNNTVEGNDIRSIGFLQNDGSMIQYMTGPATGSVTRYNWLHDCLKSGMRFDGSLDTGNTGEPGVWTPWGTQTKGQVYKNTIWNTPTGLMVKGDYHVVVNNTVFENEKVGIIMMNPPPDGANSNSICKNNIASMISGYRGGRTPNEYPLPGEHSHNWNGYFETGDVPTLVQDIANCDFRPKKNKGLINSGTSDINSNDLFPEHLPVDTLYDIGAYEYGDTLYNIAGRRLEKCTHPIPFNDGISNSDDVILAWRPAYKATSYLVFMGSSEDAVKNAATGSEEYKGEFNGNVYHPGELDEEEKIYWRVDAIKRAGIEKGDVWSFTVGVDANKKLNTSVTNFGHEGSIIFYPNPVKNSLNVKSTVHQKLRYKLININGEEIQNGELTNTIQTISVTHLKPGTYFFRIIESGDVFKLVKL